MSLIVMPSVGNRGAQVGIGLDMSSGADLPPQLEGSIAVYFIIYNHALLQ